MDYECGGDDMLRIEKCSEGQAAIVAIRERLRERR